MDRHVVDSDRLPKQIGPYSHAVTAGGFVFISGQPGVDLLTGLPAGDTFEVQAAQAFRNLAAVLDAAGSRPDLVVNTTVLLADVADFSALNEMFGAFFPTSPPARMVMTVPLPRGLLFSIGCTAIAA